MPGVMVFGTFDLLHPGHLDLFAQARRHGAPLTVVVGRDAVVERMKGRAPVESEQVRLAHVGAVPGVDRALLGDLNDHFRSIAETQPEIICLGYDQFSSLTEELPKRFPSVRIVRLEPFEPEQYKSSILRDG